MDDLIVTCLANGVNLSLHPALAGQSLFLRRLDAHFIRFRYPAAAHGIVQIDHGLQLRLLGLRVLQLNVKQAALRIEHFDEAV